MNHEKSFIAFEDVSYRYPRGKRNALRHVSLEIQRGEFVGLLGENGAGKSTLCQMLNGVVPHSRGGRMQGSVTIDGIDTQEASVAQLARTTGIVLEDPESQLFTTSVLNEVAFGPENLGVEPADILERARWALDAVRLSGCEGYAPVALSGGQKQRLSIAAALAMQPKVLVLDEATSQLDPVGTVDIFSVVSELNRQHGMTIVMATNKGGLVAQYCDRLIVLHEGRVVGQGKPREIFSNRNLLDQMMLRIPQVARLAAYLSDRGIPLRRTPVTLHEGCEEIELLMGGVC
jgi:energy-coupling factor transporter ATP-binding protein EcfA2